MLNQNGLSNPCKTGNRKRGFGLDSHLVLLYLHQSIVTPPTTTELLQFAAHFGSNCTYMPEEISSELFQEDYVWYEQKLDLE